jgi:hypothetical protein
MASQCLHRWQTPPSRAYTYPEAARLSAHAHAHLQYGECESSSKCIYGPRLPCMTQHAVTGYHHSLHTLANQCNARRTYPWLCMLAVQWPWPHPTQAVTV